MFIDTKELPVTEPVKVGIHHELAEWMRAGAAKTRPCRQGYWEYAADGVLATCAWGAVGVGAGIDPRNLDEFLGFLRRVAGDDELFMSVVAKNDNAAWSRQRIADWLCKTGGCTHACISTT